MLQILDCFRKETINQCGHVSADMVHQFFTGLAWFYNPGDKERLAACPKVTELFQWMREYYENELGTEFDIIA